MCVCVKTSERENEAEREACTQEGGRESTESERDRREGTGAAVASNSTHVVAFLKNLL